MEAAVCLLMGWGEQFPLVNDWGEVDTLDAASLSALALGKLPEKAYPAGAAGVLCPKVNSLSPL